MIILCEPQCIGIEHVEVNSALIQAIFYAFPDEKIVFFGEKYHIELVSMNLTKNNIEPSNIEFIPIKLPPKNFLNYKRFRYDLLTCKKIYKFSIINNVTNIIFCSITSSGLISIKILSKYYNNINCYIIIHGILESIIERPSFFPLETPFWFKYSLIIGNRDKISYIVLGQPILEKLCKEIPKMKRYTYAIDLPYFFKDYESLKTKHQNDIIKFGSIGAGTRYKGTDLFFKLAEDLDLINATYKHEFMLIGRISDESLKQLKPKSVFIPSYERLNRTDFDKYMYDLDYAIFFYKSTSYNLTASGALFDAISYAKPIIALKCPIIEYYFKKMGDIGYLCDSYDEIKDVVINILNNKPTDTYRRQQSNILIGREQFNIYKISKKLSQIIDKQR